MSTFIKKYQFWFKCWGVVWGILCITFAFYMVTFFLGNHDWQFIRYDMPLTSGIWEARITQFVPPWLLSLGRMLPIWNTVLGFMFLSAAAVLSAWWYGLPQKAPRVLLFSLLIVLHPYICSQLYYVHTFISIGCWHFLTVLGVVWAWNFAITYKVRYFIGAMVCLLMSLCGYVACIELLGVIVLGKLLLDILNKREINRHFVVQYIFFMGSVFLILFAYVVIMAVCRHYQLIDGYMYNTQALPFLEMALKIINNFEKPFDVLNVLIPYTSRVVNVCIWGLCVLVLWMTYQTSQRFLTILGLIGLFYASIIAAYISPHNIYYMWRLHMYSLPYLVGILFVLVMIGRQKLPKNAGFVLGVILLVSFISADLTAQKVWYLGNLQDDHAVERIKQSLLPSIKKDKHYRLSTIGNLYGRKKFAGITFVGADKMEMYREYWGAPHFINIFFSSGFFAYESYNPIWGDAMYMPSNVVFFGVNNENLETERKNEAQEFANYSGSDKGNLISKIQRLKIYPMQPYMFVGDKDIVLMLSDTPHKDLLVKTIQDD